VVKAAAIKADCNQEKSWLAKADNGIKAMNDVTNVVTAERINWFIEYPFL
jgi:hypothetical protein